MTTYKFLKFIPDFLILIIVLILSSGCSKTDRAFIKNYSILSSINGYVVLQNHKLDLKKKLSNLNRGDFVDDISSDKKKLLMTFYRNGQLDLYQYDLITDNAIQLTNADAVDMMGCYSSDDKTIAFCSNRMQKLYQKGWGLSLYVMDIDSKTVRQVEGLISVSNPTWHNKYIALSEELEKEINTLTIYDTKTNEIKRHGSGRNPIFTADGSEVIFERLINGISQLFRYNIANEKFYQLTFDKLPSINPYITDDRKYILFNRKVYDTYQIFFLETSSGEIVKLTTEQEHYNPVVF